jgi:putative tricarboxylic transport membrane protein
VLAVGIVLLGMLVAAGGLQVPGEAVYEGVGPRVVPAIVGVALALAGLAFGVSVLRGARFPAAAPPADRGALAWILGSLAAAVVLVQPLGFAPTAGLVFAATARAFGSRRIAADVALGLALGAAVYLVFARGLGVSLPGGPLDWLR